MTGSSLIAKVVVGLDHYDVRSQMPSMFYAFELLGYVRVAMGLIKDFACRRALILHP